MTATKTHTDECNELMKTGVRSGFTPTMQALKPEQQEVVFACPHEAHDIPKQIFHRL